MRDTDYVCNTWFERDRANVTLSTLEGREVFCLWDDDVTQAIEDGFLPLPKTFRPRDSDWHACAVAYARSQGLIA